MQCDINSDFYLFYFFRPSDWHLFNLNLCLCHQNPKEICVHAGFCPAMKSTPLLKLLAPKTIPAAKITPAAKTVPALKLFPATKVELAADKPAQVGHAGQLTADSHQYLMVFIS